MKQMRRLIRQRGAGGFLSAVIAYALAVQALLASIGLGMSAAAASGPGELVICSYDVASGTHAPASDDKSPSQRPQCPFCFMAAQSAGHIAAIGQVTVIPPYAGLQTTVVLDHQFDDGSVPQFRRVSGGPRAPPAISV
jgi:hypothetical protein